MKRHDEEYGDWLCHKRKDEEMDRDADLLDQIAAAKREVDRVTRIYPHDTGSDRDMRMSAAIKLEILEQQARARGLA